MSKPTEEPAKDFSSELRSELRTRWIIEVALPNSLYRYFYADCDEATKNYGLFMIAMSDRKPYDNGPGSFFEIRDDFSSAMIPLAPILTVRLMDMTVWEERCKADRAYSGAMGTADTNNLAPK